MDSPMIVLVQRWKGVMSTPKNHELRTYGELLRLNDNGKAFLKIMRSFETTKEFENKIITTLQARSFPAQVIFGKHDRELTAEKQGKDACEVLKLSTYFLVEASHFLQEDSWDELANHISELVRSGKDRVPS
jgi:pimeloyl-ACP methyl ester carboxylesterase